MAGNVKDSKLTETELLRTLVRQVIAEEGLDGFLRVTRLICDIEWRALEGEKETRDEASLWRARARLLAGVTTMAARTEGRES